MPWLSQVDAAQALGVSARTVGRRAAKGQYRTRRSGRRVLVFVSPDGAGTEYAARDHTARQLAETTEQFAQTGSRLAQIAASAAIQKKKDGDMVAATMAAIGEARLVWEKDAAIAREEAAAAKAAEGRARRLAFRACGLAATITLALVVGAAGLAWRYHVGSLAHAEEVRRLSDTLAAVVGRYQGEIEVLQDSVRTERDAERQAALELRDRLEGVGDKLATVSSGQDQLARELERAGVDRDRLGDDLAKLQDHMTATSGRGTLMDLLDSTWAAPDAAASGNAAMGPPDDARPPGDQFSSR